MTVSFLAMVARGKNSPIAIQNHLARCISPARSQADVGAVRHVTDAERIAAVNLGRALANAMSWKAVA